MVNSKYNFNFFKNGDLVKFKDDYFIVTCALYACCILGNNEVVENRDIKLVSRCEPGK